MMAAPGADLEAAFGAAELAPYRALTPILHDRVRYAVGEILHLPAARAEPLLAVGAVTPAAETAALDEARRP
jgi:hypothetical protein